MKSSPVQPYQCALRISTLGHALIFRIWYHRRVRFRAFTFTAFLFAQCSSPKQASDHAWVPIPSADLGDMVARVGSVPIFANQIKAVAKKSGISPRAILDQLVEDNLLAEAARGGGLQIFNDSDREVSSALVQRLLERELEPSLPFEAVPNADLRPLYDKTRDHFVHPRLVDIGFLAVYTGPTMQKEDREPREQTARELARYLKNHPAKSLDEFSDIARDPDWSHRHVVFRRTLQSTDKPLSEAVGKEVIRMRSPGDTTPLVIDENGGFIARYVDERPPENITLEQSRGELLPAYYEHWRRQKFIEFTTILARLHHVETYPDRLSQNDHGP